VLAISVRVCLPERARVGSCPKQQTLHVEKIRVLRHVVVGLRLVLRCAIWSHIVSCPVVLLVSCCVQCNTTVTPL
jgi:hypothetical protein